MSRVVLGVHYPGDVLAGWSLGAAAAGAVVVGVAVVSTRVAGVRAPAAGVGEPIGPGPSGAPSGSTAAQATWALTLVGLPAWLLLPPAVLAATAAGLRRATTSERR